jgi:hypothetical protein
MLLLHVSLLQTPLMCFTALILLPVYTNARKQKIEILPGTQTM